MNEREFNNCIITSDNNFATIITDKGDFNLKIYTVKHKLSGQSLRAVVWSEALKMSLLLDMDYAISKFYEGELVTDRVATSPMVNCILYKRPCQHEVSFMDVYIILKSS